MTRRLADMTTVEAAQAVRDSPVVILPAGAFEQHGPALPLSTDLVRADAVADRVVDELGGTAVIGPAIPVGVSPHHLAFAGTVSLSTTTFAALVREYVTCLADHGWHKFLVITGHGGNTAALGTVGQDLLATHPHVQFAHTPITVLAADVVARMPTGEVHGHSGEAETAQMLAIAPHLVQTDQLTPGTVHRHELDELGALSLRSGPPTLPVHYDRLSANGVLGDPRRATAEDGHAIVDAAVRRIVEFVKDWAAI